MSQLNRHQLNQHKSHPVNQRWGSGKHPRCEGRRGWPEADPRGRLPSSTKGRDVEVPRGRKGWVRPMPGRERGSRLVGKDVCPLHLPPHPLIKHYSLGCRPGVCAHLGWKSLVLPLGCAPPGSHRPGTGVQGVHEARRAATSGRSSLRVKRSQLHRRCLDVRAAERGLERTSGVATLDLIQRTVTEPQRSGDSN